jgi:hypothetical protein
MAPKPERALNFEFHLYRQIIFSPGPDGKSYTQDDIKLPINPQVFNLTE